MSKMITAFDAAQYLGLSAATVCNYIRGGRLPGDVKTGLIKHDDLLNFEQTRAKKRIKNLDAILATLEIDDGLIDDERSLPGGRLPLTGLSDLERTVLKMRGENHLTLEAIQLELDLNSRERVSQIIRRAIERLHKLDL
jgi:hypothetical protein